MVSPEKAMPPNTKPIKAPIVIDTFSNCMFDAVAKHNPVMPAIMNVKIMASNNNQIGFRALICSTINLFSRNQELPNNAGEYHTPPITIAEILAHSTASQLMDSVPIQIFLT